MARRKSAERMRKVGPSGVETLPQRLIDVPAIPTGCRPHLTERDRWQWHRTDGGNPLTTVQDFLTHHGLPVTDLTRPTTPGDHRPGQVCGAALYVSAAAGAHLLGVPTPTEPAPTLPDVVAVVYHHTTRPTPHTPPPATDWTLGPWQDSWTPHAHAHAVQAVRDAIGRGDVYQVNLVGHASAPYHGDPLPALTRLATLPGARYGGTLTGDGWAIGCASPETLVEVTGDRVLTRPIKGTRPATPAGRHDLLTSAKERAEHIMIVDLERNDLAHIAHTGTVTVDQLYAVRRWCDLWQAESTVSATLTHGTGLADLLHAVCPGGSVTGAPKRSALHHIAALEPTGRGAGMGALGWIAPGHLDLGLTIRTAATDTDHLHLWAGGGITWDSDPTAEVAEAAAKAAPLRALLAGTPPPPKPADYPCQP
ncbi:chorismate-binding protein [Micromonospora sp. SH-82]|uniref:chorismate-binding protein n=1 Tax=Micromonospora sp. SH-82 TaxID=3132938 RepID=UPI003EB99358